jgi:ATP-dependent DNA helicase RecG
MPVSVELLTGNVTGKQRNDILRRTAEGSVDILVGTHALIEPTVVFRNLGLAIVDEQHRFGVKQRARLWEKNVCPPHVLVMTATPIPRTLAMTVYGDLDVSVIDELPPGRKPIQTLHYTASDRQKLIDGLRHQLALGRQVYVVYPLIAESEKVDLKNLETGYSSLCDTFPDIAIGQVHGKMRPADKEAAMRDFSSGKTRLLVSTTVIEVGVNVPNATVMVIEDADRFGLSQLHQLRGRVGRGGEQSYCILVTKSKLSEGTRRRMQIMTETTDGFEIAEEDLKLRGPGDLEGTAQSGLPFQLKVANVVKDAELMALARQAAAELLALDPQENLPQNARIWKKMKKLKRIENYSDIS